MVVMDTHQVNKKQAIVNTKRCNDERVQPPRHDLFRAQGKESENYTKRVELFQVSFWPCCK